MDRRELWLGSVADLEPLGSRDCYRNVEGRNSHLNNLPCVVEGDFWVRVHSYCPDMAKEVREDWNVAPVGQTFG